MDLCSRTDISRRFNDEFKNFSHNSWENMSLKIWPGVAS
jgi:hypothetical protein